MASCSTTPSSVDVQNQTWNLTPRGLRANTAAGNILASGFLKPASRTFSFGSRRETLPPLSPTQNKPKRPGSPDSHQPSKPGRCLSSNSTATPPAINSCAKLNLDANFRKVVGDDESMAEVEEDLNVRALRRQSKTMEEGLPRSVVANGDEPTISTTEPRGILQATVSPISTHPAIAPKEVDENDEESDSGGESLSTTESAWMSDYSESVPVFPSDRPLLQAKDHVVNNILAAFGVLLLGAADANHRIRCGAGERESCW